MVHLQYVRREPDCHHNLNKKHKERRRDVLKSKTHLDIVLEGRAEAQDEEH
jgi:hypothetical protein